MKVVLAAVPLINTRVPPLSLALLSGQLKKVGYQVKCFDFNIETYHNVPVELKEYWTYYRGFQWTDQSYFESFIYPHIIGNNVDLWAQKILNEKPDIVGISVTLSPSAKILAERLKKAKPDLKIIIGGPSASKYYNDPEKKPGPLYDAVVHNEGELTLIDLVKQFELTKKIQPVLGASVLGSKGEIIFPGLRPVMMDLDELATPDFDDFDFALYVDADNPNPTSYREIPYYSSRGCPARCNFCMDYKMWDVRYRQKSPLKIVEEMEFLSKRYNIKNFMLIELIFNGHIPKMRELTKELKARNHGFNFWGHGRIDTRMDLETVQLLKEAGFTWFIFGLESASNKVLKNMRKGYTAETADWVLENIGTVGIGCSVNIITGFPGEEWDDYVQTIQFIYKHRKTIGHIPGLAACAAMPGSDLAVYPEKFEITTVRDPVHWVSNDGKNTFQLREFRKEFMLWVFKKFKFKNELETDKADYDINELPDPEKIFKKTKKYNTKELRDFLDTLV